MKFAFQEGLFPYENLATLYSQLKDWGFEGVETWGEGLSDRIEEVKAASKASGLPVCGICPGLHGIRGSLLDSDPAARATACRVMVGAPDLALPLPPAGALWAIG